MKESLMKRNGRNITTGVTVILGCLAVLGIHDVVNAIGARAANTSFPAQHFALEPLDGEPLTNGFVEVVHPNGPQVYARHEYQVNGGAPNEMYDVVISIWVSNLTCTGAPPIVIPAAVLVTNAFGNGHASVVHTPDDLALLGIRGLTIGGAVTLLRQGTPAYTTGCRVIQLD
jgi:hypothetical protein